MTVVVSIKDWDWKGGEKGTHDGTGTTLQYDSILVVFCFVFSPDPGHKKPEETSLQHEFTTVEALKHCIIPKCIVSKHPNDPTQSLKGKHPL